MERRGEHVDGGAREGDTEPFPPSVHGDEGDQEQRVPGIAGGQEDEGPAGDQQRPAPGAPRIAAPHDVHAHGRDDGHQHRERPAVGQDQAQERVAGPGRGVVVALLLDVAAEVAEDRAAREQDVRQVDQYDEGRGRQQDGDGVPDAADPGQRAGEHDGRHQLGGDGGADQHASRCPPREGPGGDEAESGHREEHAQHVDVRVVDRLQRDGGAPGPVRRLAEVVAAPSQDQQERPGHAEGDQGGADLERLVPGAGGGQPVDRQEVRLGDGRVDGVHGGPVDAGAVARAVGGRDGREVRAAARGAGGEEPGVTQRGEGRILRGVVVRGGPGGLHAAVPGVAVGIGAGPRGPQQPGHGDGDGPRDDQPREPPGRDPAQREQRDAEQHPADRVAPEEPDGVAEVVPVHDGEGEHRRECGQGDAGGHERGARGEHGKGFHLRKRSRNRTSRGPRHLGVRVS